MPEKQNFQSAADITVNRSLVRLTPEQLDRLAHLIAEGRFDFPHDVQPADAARLRLQVQARLRDRLVGFIARAVAHHLHRSTQHHTENLPHA